MRPLRDDGTSPWGDLAKMLGDEANRKARAQQQKAEEDRRRALGEYWQRLVQMNNAAARQAPDPANIRRQMAVGYEAGRTFYAGGFPYRPEPFFGDKSFDVNAIFMMDPLTWADRVMLSKLGISW